MFDSRQTLPPFHWLRHFNVFLVQAPEVAIDVVYGTEPIIVSGSSTLSCNLFFDKAIGGAQRIHQSECLKIRFLLIRDAISKIYLCLAGDSPLYDFCSTQLQNYFTTQPMNRHHAEGGSETRLDPHPRGMASLLCTSAQAQCHRGAQLFGFQQ